jgi:hypothetical protein
MDRKFVYVVVLLVLSVAAVNAQSQRSGPQFSEWARLVQLPAPINSVYDDQAAVLSKDEKTIYFSSNRPGSMAGSLDIWVSSRKSKYSPWRTPVNLGPTINSSGKELVRSLTSDGHLLLFQSDRADGGFGQADIWVITRKQVNDDSGWSEPINLGGVINTPYTELASNYLFVDSSNVRRLYFSSNKPGGFGGPDIYESTITDQGFETSSNVVELNTPSIETCFWIRDDGLEIIFSSNRPNLYEDRRYDDLWTASRNSVFEPWSAAVNLGPSINTVGYREVAPFVTFDGKTLLISSTRPGGMAAGTFDIYMATRQRVRE